jgi:DNA-directed RNA polymerase specialized sigma24 family protein
MTSDPSESTANPVVARLQANHRQFLNFLAARVGSREDAEEILQDAFVRGLRKAGDKATARNPPTVLTAFCRQPMCTRLARCASTGVHIFKQENLYDYTIHLAPVPS